MGVSDGKLDDIQEGELDGLLMDGLLLKEGVSEGVLDGFNGGELISICNLT